MLEKEGRRCVQPALVRRKDSTPYGQMNELAGQSLGGYVLEEELGRGSMGMVYRGKQVALAREVAVKILPSSLAQDPSYIARFIREAQIIAGLNHPNIVQIYDAGQQNGVLYFVMEFVQGPTISSLLHLDGSIPQHLAAEYVAQIADALDAAYKERNVIHRDIKPENLMLDRWGRIKVMDFGLARAPGLQQITVAKTLVGSIYYASPEQIWGKPLDNRSDIYALGVVLYEMVTGQRPYSGRTLQELTATITAGRVIPPTALAPDLSPELERIILTAMAPNRDQRFAQAGLLAEELRALQLRAPSVGPIGPRHDQNPATSAETPGLLPKRPQAQRPHFPSIDTLLTLPMRDQQAHPLAPDTPDQAEQPIPPSFSEYDTSPEHLAQTYPLEQEESFLPALEESSTSEAGVEEASKSSEAHQEHRRQNKQAFQSS
jgi:eukaryotic-like serine/threonine-protein kinase